MLPLILIARDRGFKETTQYEDGTVRFEHESRQTTYGWPETNFVYTQYLCPYCKWPTESFNDCAGKRGVICAPSFMHTTVTGKKFFGCGCASTLHFVCTNTFCDWEWFSHGSPREHGVAPLWAEEVNGRSISGVDDDDIDD